MCNQKQTSLTDLIPFTIIGKQEKKELESNAAIYSLDALNSKLQIINLKRSEEELIRAHRMRTMQALFLYFILLLICVLIINKKLVWNP